MAGPPDKKVLNRTPDDSKIDRLSALPDGVLLHILSRFATKEAAATSVLSRRWRDLFVLLPDIDLSFRVENDTSDSDRLFSDFIDFASRVILGRNGAPIRKIFIFVDHFCESYRMIFESLLASTAAVISLSSIQELKISVLIDKTTKPFSLSVPSGIFTCKTLVSLSLYLGAEWRVPDLVCLPNLKVLDLKRFTLVDEDCIAKFLQGCPLVEQLILLMGPGNYESEGDGRFQAKVLDISSPLLKNVILWCWGVEFELTTIVKSNNLEHLSFLLKGKHKVTIDAPNLRSLRINGQLLEVNIIQNLISLDDALGQFDFLYYARTESDILLRSQHAFKFVRGLQNVKSLDLSESILMALYFSQRGLPAFKNLIKLQLGPSDCPVFPRFCMSHILSRLFESCPNLEVLILSEVSKNYLSEDEENVSVFEEALPLVLVEHLEEIEIRNFFGEEHEVKLVEFFLKSGISLKKMTLFGEACASVLQGLDRILSFKKCSEDCQIVSKKKWDWMWGS